MSVRPTETPFASFGMHISDFFEFSSSTCGKTGYCPSDGRSRTACTKPDIHRMAAMAISAIAQRSPAKSAVNPKTTGPASAPTRDVPLSMANISTTGFREAITCVSIRRRKDAGDGKTQHAEPHHHEEWMIMPSRHWRADQTSQLGEDKKLPQSNPAHYPRSQQPADCHQGSEHHQSHCAVQATTAPTPTSR